LYKIYKLEKKATVFHNIQKNEGEIISENDKLELESSNGNKSDEY